MYFNRNWSEMGMEKLERDRERGIELRKKKDKKAHKKSE